jgi:redox-sensitive bicupin YhaK (pirin superfamily)
MTAGSGVIHQEMPRGDPGGLMWGFQLWANLPAADKMMAPRYRDVRQDQIPLVALEGGVQVRVICGQVNGVRGPVRDIVIDPQYLDVSMPPHSKVVHPIPRGHTAFVYLFEGRAYFCGQRDPYAYPMAGANYFDMQRDAGIGAESVALFDDGDQVVVCTEEEPARFLLISGRPIGEPVAWYGPIVMNTQQELRVAFQEYQRGTFIK